MSWALSCHSLREHYGEVVLYTDSEGARMLVDKLRLPYTDVATDLDDFCCLECHWALAKVRTYAAQTRPFMHVDGDIYLPRPLPAALEQAPLLAQNEEKTTAYYRAMIDRLLAVEGLRMSPLLESALRGGGVPSFNLGFCGGTDLEFFGRYCYEVRRFFDENDFNGERFRRDDISANVVFEQMFFSILAREEGKDISTLWPGIVDDNGYRAADFCDMAHYDSRQFVHVLGGHKRTPWLCDMLEKTLLRKYPGSYERVASLFPHRHPRLFGRVAEEETRLPADDTQYSGMLRADFARWRSLPASDVVAAARAVACGAEYLAAAESKRTHFHLHLHLHPYAVLHTLSAADSPLPSRRFGVSAGRGRIDVAVIPTVSARGYAEMPLDAMGCNVVAALSDAPATLPQLVKKLAQCFPASVDETARRSCVDAAVARLVERGIVCASGE